MSSAHDFTIQFIINGQEFPTEINAKAALMSGVQKALAESGNSGRPPEDWELRDATGALLDKHLKPVELGITSGTRLFLTLQVGAGGDACRTRR